MRSWLFVLLLATVTLTVQAVDPVPEEEERILHVARVIRQIAFPGGAAAVAGAGGATAVAGGGAAVATAGCNCVPLVTCATELKQVQNACTLQGGVPGVCCPNSFLASLSPAKGTGDDRVFVAPAPAAASAVASVDAGVVSAASQAGLSAVQSFQSLENQLISQGIVLPAGSPALGHLRFFTVRPDVVQMDQNAYAIAMASRNIFNDLSESTRQGGATGLRNVPVSNTPLGDVCPQTPVCENTNRKYRTADGACNNPNFPAWGKSGTPLQRILPSKYDDGVITARNRSVADGSALPNIRVISSNILVDVDNPDQDFTSSVMQWSQFLDHDLTHVPFPSLPNGDGIDCCPNGQRAPDNQLHPRCMPIDLTGDAFFTPKGRSCMNFVRSMLAIGPGTDCRFGPAEQVNQLTHWLDGSMIYGSNRTEQLSLRTRSDGLMATSGNNHLPLHPNQDSCGAAERGGKCFLAGDSRSNETPGLTGIHIVWIREHNRIARALKALNPTWSDDALFQEARRIVIAELQHITYNEYLPIIVGPNFMRSYGINTRLRGYSNDYNPNINPNMNNEFSTAAFRFGHTLVQGIISLFSPTGQVNTIQLRDHFNSPHLIQQNAAALDMIIRSFTQSPIQSFDSFITKELTNHLFQTPKVNFGMDLMSLNIHRGRDHAIATYNEVRQICGLPRARNFNEIKDQIPAQIADNLARVYKSVDDIDFFVGGITEKPVSDGLLGWTFLCVVGDQFARIKKGDRYFYDLGGQPGSFSEGQLQEIRRTSWARVLCDNADNLQQIQPLAFLLPNSPFNKQVPCNSPIIPRPNLELWKGERAGA